MLCALLFVELIFVPWAGMANSQQREAPRRVLVAASLRSKFGIGRSVSLVVGCR
jgi:hypothetical protein